MRAKFRIDRITDYGHSKTLHLSAVTGGPSASDEDKSFWDATPAGTIEICVTNLEAVKDYRVGHDFYVDFSCGKEG